MQTSGLPQPPGPPMMRSSATPQDLGPPMPMQLRPMVPLQQTPQFMPQAAQQFLPVGQPMPGVNIVMPEHMPHFPQPRQHLPHSIQVPTTSQGLPISYQPARPISSAPMQPQQQAAYPWGHLPSMGAPMPSYTYQPTSIPPVVQSRGTALGQSVPHVTLVQPGHQLVSSPSILPSVNSSEPTSSDWKEHTAAEGKKYYHNKKTRQSSWEKPVELMTPLEKADASTEWKEFTTPEGRKYYFNKVTKQSKWSIPDELKVARELAKRTSNQQPDQETGTTASALVGSAASKLSTVPANQCPSAVGIIAPSSRDALANSIRPGAGLSHNVDNTSSSSIFGMQNGGTSTDAVSVTTNTEVPLVATDGGTSRNNYINSSVTTAADTQDGTSAEDLKEATKTVSVAGEIYVNPLEEETSEEEPIVYATKTEAKNAFKSLLESVNVESDWTWDQTMKVIINDKRYGVLNTLGERKQAFYEYLNQRKRFEAEEKRVKQRKSCDDFLEMLEECKDLTSSTRWSKAILMFEDDERFKAVEHPREREDLYENYLLELHNKEHAKAVEERKINRAEYRAFLESCDFIKVTTQWRKVQERLEDDERCCRLKKIDRLDVFQGYIRHLEKEEEEQKQIQKELVRRQERKNRDGFRKMVEEHVSDGTITARTRWRDYCAQIKKSQAYCAVASNLSGSTPKDLFDDVIEELDKQIPMTTSWTLNEFQTAILADNVLKGISTINIELIYDDQIERLKEKDQKEAKKRQQLGENFSDLLYSIKEVSASSTWDDSKGLFKDSQEFRALDSETYARELFEECVVHLKERLKEKERLREEEKAKREKERKEKEKERKEKEQKEKEREWRKEREKEKQKDRSRRDEMDIDGAVDTHGLKDKKRHKDKEKKRKRCRHDSGDVSSERGDKYNFKRSRRHRRGRKKSRKHSHASDSASENKCKINQKDQDSCQKNGAHELEDGELGEDGEVH
ncbi:unnamed protein product [Urochloa humidicola]